MPPTLAQYLARFAYCPPAIAEPPAPGLALVVVVPMFDEPHPTRALAALAACDPPQAPVEVIVVVNAPADCTPQVRRRTAHMQAQVGRWTAENQRAGLRFHLLPHPALPPRHAGVGLARKIGMDEAAARLVQAGNAGGVIAGFDADCGCTPDYLVALTTFFQQHPPVGAASVYFEHPAAGSGDPREEAAIVQYELYLRYFRAGLRFAGYPFPYHTLGSCMAVRAQGYLAQGGMNRRQAGEDFYFLSKFMRSGVFAEIRTTTVFPSGRASHRVPFGTGRTVRDLLAQGGGPVMAHPPEIFLELRGLLAGLPSFFDLGETGLEIFLDGLSPAMRAFLPAVGFRQKIAALRANSRSPATFAGHFFHWLDRFRVLKFAQYAARHHYPREPVAHATARLLVMRGEGFSKNGAEPPRPQSLLAKLRAEERSGTG